MVLVPVLHRSGGHERLEWQRCRPGRGERHEEWRTGEGHTGLQPVLALGVGELGTQAGVCLGGDQDLGPDQAMADCLRTGLHPDLDMMEEIRGS